MTAAEAVARAERTLHWRKGQAAVSVDVDVLTALVAAARETAGRPKLEPGRKFLPLPRLGYEWRHVCGAVFTTRDGEPTPSPCPVCREQHPIYWLLNSWLCPAE